MSEKEVPPDVRRLVIAARIVAFEDQGREALKELDEASEAFADRIPWDDEPAAGKESEVMPPGTRAETPTATREAATSPGVTAGASGLEPLDEIGSIASAELQQRADAALGDKSRWKIIDRAPSPDEVERVSGKRLDDLARIANAIPDSDLSFMHVHRNELLMMLAELRIKRIAAMNRAPQPSREEDITNTKMLSVLENAFVEGGLWAEQYLAWNEGCSSRDLKEALQKHQDMMLTMNPASQPSREEMLVVLKEIATERTRQIEAEGWTPEHDDAHTHGEIARAAACYTLGYIYNFRSLWPWDWKWWKRKERRRELVIAGALIIAEIERLDRARAIIAKASKKAVEDV